MIKKKEILNHIAQIYALVIKDLKLKNRYKTEYFVEFFLPFLSLFFPYIIFSTLFSLEGEVFKSYYSADNFVLFLLLGYCIECFILLLYHYQDAFKTEKVWKTFGGLIVAPLSKYDLLISFFLSGLISKSFSIIIILIICCVFFPIPLITLILVIIVLFCISITFAGMGFILGLFEIVNEDISASLAAGISFIAIISCLFYPIEIFPEQFHFLIRLNPLYYYFDLFRLTWWSGINHNEAMSYITIWHILVVVGFTIITPVFASYFFLKVYNKFGISGY